MGVTTALRRVTNFSRNATKAASSSLQEVVSAAQNPTSKSDYVETGNLFISKALIIRLLLGLIALGLIVYFLVWPFVLSHFLTAKFFVEDKRVANWSGRVIVYSDQKKKTPLYSGRLEDGVLQGECRQYDGQGVLLYEGMLENGERTGSGKLYENGALVYDGQFSAGLYNGFGETHDAGGLVYVGQYDHGKRSGNGKAYENGTLLYEGQFLDDLYEGRGKLYEGGALVYDGSFSAGAADGTGTAYEGGKLLYEGQYADGAYEGRGKLYEDGVLVYDGVFHAGEAEGTGTAYYPSGKIAYQGSFLAGKRDGSGVAYGTDGAKVYEGSFSEGLYSGSGTLFFSDGGQLEANFLGGEPTGNVTWRKNGFLYYQGEWADGAPNGFGTLFSRAGKKLYEGPFRGGTIDGGALLDYTAELLRAVLCESTLRNETERTGFLIISDELGLAALCSFQTETAESAVCRIALSAPEKDDWVALLPGADHNLPVQWPEGASAEQLTVDYAPRSGERLSAGSYAAERAETETQRVAVLYADQTRAQAVLLTWDRTDVSLSPLKTDGGGQDGKVEKLLDAMDKMINSDGTAGASFGGVATDNAFVETTSAAEAVGLADAMVDFWMETQRLNALEEISERKDALLDDARDAAAKGVGAQETITALQEAQTELSAQIEMTKTAIKRAELQASQSGVTWMIGYALEEMLVSFDPGEQDISGLVVFAVAYAKATGSERTEGEIEREVKEALLNLSDAHSAAKLALARQQSAADAAESALNDYSMGLGSKQEWFDAKDAEALARVELYAALADFTKQANHFNLLTGGWVSRTFHWHNDVFEPLLRAAVLPESAAAEQTPEATGTDETDADAAT